MRDSTTLFSDTSPPLVSILLVDDNELIRRMMMQFITNFFKSTKKIPREKIEFDQAFDGENAQEMVKHHLAKMGAHYDVIIMDLYMDTDPEKCGLAATKAIRAFEEEAGINKRPAYIIRYSTEEPYPTEDELKAQGFDAMLNKKQTKPAEVHAALGLALTNHPAFKQNNANPKHSN